MADFSRLSPLRWADQAGMRAKRDGQKEGHEVAMSASVTVRLVQTLPHPVALVWRGLIGLVLAILSLQARELPLARAARVVMPVFLGTNAQPSATLEIQEVRRGHQRLGFLRVGLLPVCVADGVVVRLATERDGPAVLGEIQGLVEPLARQRRIELLRFGLVLPGETAPRLMARRVSCTEDGVWRLGQGVELELEGAPLRADVGTLRVTGAEAGRLVLSTREGRRVIDLLGPRSATREPRTPGSARGQALSVGN